MIIKMACVHSKHDNQDDDKVNTLAFVNFLLVKIFLTQIHQISLPSKFCAIYYVTVYVTGFEITRLPHTQQQDTLFSIIR